MLAREAGEAYVAVSQAECRAARSAGQRHLLRGVRLSRLRERGSRRALRRCTDGEFGTLAMAEGESKWRAQRYYASS